VRDWAAFVHSRLRLPDLTPGRESRIVRELAAQLEDFYRDALARGASDADADAHACRQVRDWERLTQDVWLADRPHARPRLDRLADAVDLRAGNLPGPGQRGVHMFADVLRDTRYGIRQLGKSPGFTTVAILTLALGIGATSAMFSVINGVLLRPLPYPHPETLMRVHEIVPQYGRFSVAPATFLDWRQQNTVFERIGAYTSGSATFSDAAGPERVSNATVSWDMFDVLGTAPMLGRGFRADEDAPGKSSVVVLSHGLWQRRFAADPNVLGRSVTLNGSPSTIVGVMPPGFYFPSREAEFWTPIAIDPADAPRGAHFIGVLGRLKPGVSQRQAEAEMRTISERLAQQYPQASANESAELVALHEAVIGDIRPALGTLMAAVGVLILIACANVANLLLVRASVRAKEIAIRSALGAGHRRLVLQMLSESLVLSLAGGALGLLLAYLAIGPIKLLSAGSIPRVEDIAIDPTVLGFALAVSLLTGLLFGLAPAWQSARGGVAEVLKEGGRSSTLSGGRWVRSGLLIAEVALSIVLLVGATLLLRSFARLTNVDPGFRAENVLAFRVALPRASYPEDEHRVAFFDKLLGGLDALPQVTTAGMVQTLPMRGSYFLTFEVQGRPAPKPGEKPSASHRIVSPGYFAALGIPLVRGRMFTDRDREKSPMVAVVDEAFVGRHFPQEDPIGRGLDIGNGSDGFYEIVGVVGNVRHGSLDSNPNPTMYVPFKQDVFSQMWIVVRADGDPIQLSPVARQTVREIDPGLPAFAVVPLSTVVSDSVAPQRFSMLLLGLFAVVALFLAAVGLYGVVAYSVSQRTQEIGLRMAIGAQRGDVLGMVVGGGMKLALIGVAIGIAGALALSGVVRTMLFGVTRLDAVSYAATSLVLLTVAALACYVPARRATRVDPITALRNP
jgi:putative ABC transport system permease protein